MHSIPDMRSEVKAVNMSQEEMAAELARWDGLIPDRVRHVLQRLYESKKQALLDAIARRDSDHFNAEIARLENWARV